MIKLQLNLTKVLAKIENQLNLGNANVVLFQFKLQYKFQSEKCQSSFSRNQMNVLI